MQVDEFDYMFPSTSKLLLHRQFYTSISILFLQGQPVAIEMPDLNAVELVHSFWLSEDISSE